MRKGMTFMEEYRRWLASGRLTEAERRELEEIANRPEEIRERFFAPLEFGTAGLRGIMGPGIRRMNGHIVRQATRALAGRILEQGGDWARRGAVVCYDCRNHSREYAREAACVLAAAGVHVLLFPELRPTPELSFAIRHHGAAAGLNITASHNPKEYNGYKVYWSDGAQLPPDQAELVAKAMAEIDPLGEIPAADYETALAQGQITLLGEETDEAFLEQVLAQSLHPGAAAQAGLKIVYTPFYGAGARLVPMAMSRLGVQHLLCVEEQMLPDGDFPTAKNPNPEVEVGFERALALAKREQADLIIGTDPDSDRLGLMVPDGAGSYRLLSGDQVGVLFLDYLIEGRRAAGTLPDNAMALKSLVSSEMARAVAAAAGVDMEDTFTGFKFLAEKMKEYENGEKTVIFAYEEAIGYAFGTFVRDKDAVTAAVMAAEMASFYALQGKCLPDRLEELYRIHGRYAERTISLMMPGVDGLEDMKLLMQRLRQDPPGEIAGRPVECLRDHLGGLCRWQDGREETLALSGSNVLVFLLAGEGRVTVRPSGTEPKVKAYLAVRGRDQADAEAQLDALEAWVRTLADG